MAGRHFEFFLLYILRGLVHTKDDVSQIVPLCKVCSCDMHGSQGAWEVRDIQCRDRTRVELLPYERQIAVAVTGPSQVRSGR
ncbi:hypothetical protein DACRYDRAFT_21459 [Dacryopinax primogenitus]|uniref:Secreted protein n=1 Tax=Dacryopinax primogenitus (strain DJM 731) TaxID=1858805 RepID=M5G4Q4_DACPD|nr:uncharacterized protein DACRYDRAFT_21459 [Dacryopinax primogenitus]EJU03195.1 hypothetical protein DACRYDRAFT_21459 [Dacryopinax primogenitus]